MKPGSMNLFHSASIGKCFHKKSEALKNASNEIRKYEITSKGTRIMSELKYDISNASLASLAIKSVTSQKAIHFKKPGNEKFMTENCQNWKWPKRIRRWCSRRWFCTTTAKCFPWRASVVRFSSGLNNLNQSFISLQYYTGKKESNGSELITHFSSAGPCRRMKAPGQLFHLNRWRQEDSQGRACKVQNTFDGFEAAVFF